VYIFLLVSSSVERAGNGKTDEKRKTPKNGKKNTEQGGGEYKLKKLFSRDENIFSARFIVPQTIEADTTTRTQV
jgi:hypothetical protein